MSEFLCILKAFYWEYILKGTKLRKKEKKRREWRVYYTLFLAVVLNKSIESQLVHQPDFC